MKIFAHFDTKGTIRAVISVEGREGTVGMPTPTAGTFVAEIDGLKLDGLKIKSGTPEMIEALRAMVKDHKVESALPRCTLTKKGKSSKKEKAEDPEA